MSQRILLVVVLLGLVLFAGVQIYEISQLKQELSGSTGIVNTPTASSAEATRYSTPSSNPSQMVGGC